MNKSKGFTIIELIVVIAIIAVLAAIVLVNVTQYINKGKDAAIEGNMATLLTNGATFYDTNHTYTGFCAANFAAGKPIFDQDPSATADKVCVESATEWAACSQLLTTAANYWCVDSSGTKKSVTAACADFDATVCP
ncbi:MAG: prepilin-type N-terminal cleavage/methylation domain-containing protein [Candidatus Staskawiczbacteria bacterium]|nr:prepilin-type N-terminal cleavage/methylation domain-containing protein [Candidatus Staskawiczbacteria bacterium]